MKNNTRVLFFLILGIILLLVTACGVNREIDDFSDAAIQDILNEAATEEAIENRSVPTTETSSQSPTTKPTKTAKPTQKPTDNPTLAPVPTATKRPHITNRTDLTVYGLITFKRWYYEPVETCGNTYLKLDDWVIVSMDPGANNVRMFLDEDPIFKVWPGESMYLINGPLCHNGFIYWEARFKDQDRGWIAEGDGSEQWLTPIDNLDEAMDAFDGTNTDRFVAYEQIVGILLNEELSPSKKESMLKDIQDEHGWKFMRWAVSLLPVYTEDNAYNPLTFDELTNGAITDLFVIQENAPFVKDFYDTIIDMTRYDTTGDELMYYFGWD